MEMEKMANGKQWGYWVLWGMAAALSACGGGGGSTGGGNASPPAINGVAATGAGIANATVTAKCASGSPLSGTTDFSGSYTLVLNGRSLPCMVQVTGGTPPVTLHSFAQAAGRVNITPVTDLIVAKALGSDPAAAFTAFDATQGANVEAGLAAAKTYVATELSAITGASIADPLTGAFTVGDADDKVLDALGNALTASGKNIDDLRAQAQTGATLSTTVAPYLAAPAGLVATASSSTTIGLVWNAVPGATGYKVYRSTSSGVSTAGTATATSTSTSYSDSGLSAATAYYYKVVPTNSVVSAGTASAETNATTSAANVGSNWACDTSLFQQGAAVRSPTAQEMGTFAQTYTGSEGDFGSNPGDPFVASGSATLVLGSDGSATYNSAAYAVTSYCLETLSGNGGTQLVLHAGASSHFDLRTSGAWSGYTSAGKVVTDVAYVSAGSSFGSVTISGNPVGIQGAAVPATFTPSAFGTHPTAPISWSLGSGSTIWYLALKSDTLTSTASFGSWQKQAVLAGIESLGVSFDMPNGHISFTNVTLPAFSLAQTGSMVLNGTLNVPAATGTALTITGTGSNAAGSGMDAPAATKTSVLLGAVTKDMYLWNGGKGISIQVDVYSNGSKTVTVTNSAGPSWRNASPGTSVLVDTNAKTVSFSSVGLTGISPTTTALTLQGTLTLP